MDFIRNDLNDFGGYTPGKQLAGMDIIKLNTNENPYPPSPRVKECLRSLDTDQLRRYPSSLCDELRSACSEAFQIPTENILAGNGSDDLLTMIYRAFMNPDDTAVTAFPTYTLYRDLAVIRGCKFKNLDRNADYSLPQELANSNAKLCLVANPNSPTGTQTDKETLIRLARDVNGILVIDEAYADFASENCLDLWKLPNVIVLRTLSKSYSLAGIRLGFAFAQKSLVDDMIKVKDSYNVNRITQLAGTEAIRDKNWAQKNIDQIKIQRERTQDFLTQLGWIVTPSEANFVWTRPANPSAETIYNHLLERKILVRYFPGPMTGNHLRITIGTPDDMDNLFNAIREITS